MSEDKQIIEVNGVKLEVDMRHAKRLDTFKVGDRLKVLKKKYSDEWHVYHGVVIGFEPFEQRPTIVVAYIEDDMSDPEIKMLYFNSSTKDVEIVAALDDDRMAISKQHVLSSFDKKIRVKQREIEEIEDYKQYFLNKFGCYFEDELEQQTA